MAEFSAEDHEGRLNAHRELLVSLLAILAGKDKDALRFLEMQAAAPDGEEDPGVVPTPAFAAGNAMAEEIRGILRTASERNERMERS